VSTSVTAFAIGSGCGSVGNTAATPEEVEVASGVPLPGLRPMMLAIAGPWVSAGRHKSNGVALSSGL